jgi:hypothetical protein
MQSGEGEDVAPVLLVGACSVSVTVVLTEREARALVHTVEFSRIVFERLELALEPDENKLASAHLKLLSALERQETPAAVFEAMGCAERGAR